MSWDGSMAACRRAALIGDALLDGRPLSGADRLHQATCDACSREAELAARFLGHLALAADAAMEEVPQPPAASWLPRVLVPAALVAGAAAAGLLLAAVVGLRLTPPVGPAPALGSAEAAHDRLAAMGLPCFALDGGVRCQSRAADHVHRVLLTERDGEVTAFEAGIIGTQGRAIDLRGADDLLRRMATATLEGSSHAAATAWLATTYAECEGSCSADVADMHVVLEKRDDAVILSIEAR